MVCRGLQDAGRRVTEAKRKVDGAKVLIRAHNERCRRVGGVRETAEEDLNGCLGRVCQLIRDIAGRHHMRCHAVPLTEILMKYGTCKRVWT